MTQYYDPLYGVINVDRIIFEIASETPELQRLRHIGMMNFKSLNMLPLTTISRLEHSIGCAYLTQEFLKNNSVANFSTPDLLVAALYHDVNCGSFGHSIEWAINRYTSFEHEEDANWATEKNHLKELDKKPTFLEQGGLHVQGFIKRYNLKMDQISSAIRGEGCFVLNNSGIDLDNIDNVFRMANCLGLLEDRSIPLKLVRSLRIVEGTNNFVTTKDGYQLILEWFRLRSEVYRLFIYSKEYMSFEFLLFELVRALTEVAISKESIKEIFNCTDEWLLWTHTNHEDKKISKLAKRLLLHRLPVCYSIFRTEDFSLKASLENDAYRDDLAREINSRHAVKDLNVSIHLTTDDKKTNRKIDFVVNDEQGGKPASIGEDARYVLLSVLGEKQLDSNDVRKLNSSILDILSSAGFSLAEFSSELTEPSQQKLFQ
ncbi:MAG TPA: hypothetical protein VKA31_06975 [Mariprofundaceae bacterium]|nr:hypothetical protein [Mariprofundaceae bacterium]